MDTASYSPEFMVTIHCHPEYLVGMISSFIGVIKVFLTDHYGVLQMSYRHLALLMCD
ncbi:MAG: hypothetical protein ACOYJ1_07675 [Peptococcales bacterium]